MKCERRGKGTTSYTGTSFMANGNIVNGNIVKWGTKQFFGNYENSSITVLKVIELLKWGTKQVFGNYESSSIMVLGGRCVIGDAMS